MMPKQQVIEEQMAGSSILTSTLLNRFHHLAVEDGSYYVSDNKKMHQLYFISQHIPIGAALAIVFPAFFGFINSYYFHLSKVFVALFSVLIFSFLNHNIYWVAFNCVMVSTVQICHILTLNRVVYVKVLMSTQVLYIVLNTIVYFVCLWDQFPIIDQAYG
jgi:hypothetical protein